MNSSTQQSGMYRNPGQDATSSARIGSNSALMDACNSVDRTYNHMSPAQKALGVGLLVGAAVVAGTLATGYRWRGNRSPATNGSRSARSGKGSPNR